MNLDQLPYITTIASTGNLSAAAKELGISTAALSKYLRNLEKKVGVELFFRSKRQYLPTLAGRAYIRTAQHILELCRHAKASVAALRVPYTSQLRIGVTPNRGIGLLAQLYPDFDKRYPQVELDIHEGYINQLRELLHLGKLDGVIGIHSGPAPDGLRVLPYYDEELVLAVPSFYPTVHHDTGTLEDLPFADLHNYRDSVFILPRPDSLLHSLILEIFRKADFHPRTVSSSTNTLIPEAMIRSGVRVGLLPSYYVRPNPDIAFFRLRNSVKLTFAYLSPAEREFSVEERYLLYLFLKHEMGNGRMIHWNSTLEAILCEFDPMEAVNRRLEAPNGH